MTITFDKGFFVAHSIFDEAEQLKSAGFHWEQDRKKWITRDYHSAERLIEHCDSVAKFQIKFIKDDMQKAVLKSASADGSSIHIYHHPNVTPYPYQQSGVEYMLPRPAVLLADQMGLGKALSVDTMVITPYGKQKMGNLKVGNKVIGSDGKPYNVTGVFPQGLRPLFRITFNDGFSILADDQHLWKVSSRNKHKDIILTTGQMLDKDLSVSFNGTGWNAKKPYPIKTYYKENNGNNKWQIPVVKPIQFSSGDKLPIDPYLLGVLLGDGSIADRKIRISLHKSDFYEILYGFEYTEQKPKKNQRTASLPYLKKDLISLGLLGRYSNDKFIPDVYKYASVSDRISLLKGLMDTDGTPLSGDSGTEYSTVSKELCDDVCDLVHSIGGIVRVKEKIPTYTYKGVKKKGQKAYRLNIKLPEGINPFRLHRKFVKYVYPTKYPVNRYIEKIEFEKMDEAICIRVDSPDHLFVAEHGIVTHNTGQALLVMNMRTPVEALIVCPSILKYNWLKEARKWMIGHITAYIYESKKIRYYKAQLTNHNKQTTLHIINYDILSKFKDRLLATPFNFFVGDEFHYAKNADAARTKICQELARKAKWKIFITGTPIYNKPKDLYVCLNLIDPEMFGNFYAFATKYCGARKVSVAKGKSVMKYEGATNVDELNTILRANYMVRRMAVDVLKDLPEKIKDVIVLNESDLDGIVQKEQKALEDSKVQEEKLKREAEELKELAKTNHAYELAYKEKVKNLREIKFKNFGEISRIRKELAVKKVPYVSDFVKDWLEDNNDPQSKIVVFGHHTEVLETLYVNLKAFNPVIVTGKVSDNERQRAISLFKEKNDTRVFLASMGAAGTGVDGLQNNCNTVVFAELDWTPSLVDQAESRLQRIGQKNTVWVYHIVADGSIDSRIVRLMMEKEAVAKEILDYRPDELYDRLINDATVKKSHLPNLQKS